ncbi:MAG: hypothetical protein QOE01_1993 [Actinomycetota bacterium]|nr:hypothetical protein [Actinomycetota bacterium]
MKHQHRRPTHSRRRTALAVGTLFVAVITALGASSPAMAAKGSGGGGGKPAPSGSSTLSLVLLDSTDGVAHFGQQVTFDASSSATTEPHVSLKCSQNGVVVYTTQAGYYASYPWPWTQTMTLSSGAWTGGAAECSASLYYFNGSKTVTAATLGFHVDA